MALARVQRFQQRWYNCDAAWPSWSSHREQQLSGGRNREFRPKQGERSSYKGRGSAGATETHWLSFRPKAGNSLRGRVTRAGQSSYPGSTGFGAGLAKKAISSLSLPTFLKESESSALKSPCRHTSGASGRVLNVHVSPPKQDHCSYHKEHGSVHFKSTKPPEPVDKLLWHSISHVRVQSGLHLHRQGVHTAGCLQAFWHAALCLGSSRSQWSAMHWFTEPKQSLPITVASKDDC
jgi:hypothetical protein